MAEWVQRMILKALISGYYGKITLHIEDGKVIRVNEDRSYVGV